MNIMSTVPFEFEIKEAKTEDRERILQFLRIFFFKDEPCNAYLKVVTEENPINEDLETFSMNGFDNGLSLLAIHEGKLIGVCLNAILEKGQKKSMKCKDEKFSKILNLFNYVGSQVNIFDKYPECDRGVAIGIVSVDESYRGKGIAKKLMEKTRQIGKERGCGFITVDCTSHFTACAVKRLGFELYYSLNYEDYKVDGQVVLKPQEPHRAFTVYTKKID
ncbi:arylalkylamine N-acetyltransferase 1-like isoform X2 [Leptinotarsa decemlineata]|uniref:arylalkylamine N-acetyltransferase 1-like isoform X1 n=1 Tax=Leptinotarsa decemlineata TaxID=7539 RepID=UPI003D307DD0